MSKTVMRFLRWLIPEPTYCGGCKRFSRGDACPSRECNPPRQPRRVCDHRNCEIVEGEPGGPYRWSCGRIEG